LVIRITFGNLVLSTELPCDAFALFITREVEVEGRAIPDDAVKAPLKEYIQRTIEQCGIQTTSGNRIPSPRSHNLAEITTRLS